MTVKVAGVWDVSTTSKLFLLVHPTGGLLPRFTPGSHIVIHMRDGGKVHRNSYTKERGTPLSVSSASFPMNAW
jgi:ferredoxin-NADP reductase